MSKIDQEFLLDNGQINSAPQHFYIRCVSASYVEFQRFLNHEMAIIHFKLCLFRCFITKKKKMTCLQKLCNRDNLDKSNRFLQQKLNYFTIKRGIRMKPNASESWKNYQDPIASATHVPSVAFLHSGEPYWVNVNR